MSEYLRSIGLIVHIERRGERVNVDGDGHCYGYSYGMVESEQERIVGEAR